MLACSRTVVVDPIVMFLGDQSEAILLGIGQGIPILPQNSHPFSMSLSGIASAKWMVVLFDKESETVLLPLWIADSQDKKLSQTLNLNSTRSYRR